MRTGTLIRTLLVLSLMGVVPLVADDKPDDPTREARQALTQKGLSPRVIPLADFHKGVEPENFQKRTGAAYAPSTSSTSKAKCPKRSPPSYGVSLPQL